MEEVGELEAPGLGLSIGVANDADGPDYGQPQVEDPSCRCAFAGASSHLCTPSPPHAVAQPAFFFHGEAVSHQLA